MTAIDAGEWLLPAGSRELRWIRKTGAVLPVVVGSAGVEGITSDELRGGESFGWVWGFALRWFPVAPECLGSWVVEGSSCD